MSSIIIKKPFLWLLAAVLAGGTALLLWKPWVPVRRLAVDPSNAGAVVSEAQAVMGQVGNYRYTTNINAGNEIKVSILNRVVTGAAKRQMVDFTWDIPGMSGTAAVYAEGKSLYIYHPLKDRWVLPAEEPTLGPFIDFFWRQLALVDPVDNLLRLDPNGRNLYVTRGGQDDGELITVEAVPQGGALAEITKALPPQFAGAELKNVKQVFRISRRDFTVAEYVVTARVAMLYGLKQMDFYAVSRPQGFNTTTVIVPKPLQDKIDSGLKAR